MLKNSKDKLMKKRFTNAQDTSVQTDTIDFNALKEERDINEQTNKVANQNESSLNSSKKFDNIK